MPWNSTAALGTGLVNGTRSEERSRVVAYALVAAATLIVQFVLAAITLPLSEIASELPLFHIDGAYHWYNMKVAANLALTGNAVGYDPFFNAGFVDGIHYYVSGRLPALMAALFSPGIDEIPLYKAYVFGSSVLAPLCIVGAAVALRLAPREAAIASALGIAMWWVSYLRWYFTAGMVGYVTTCYLAVLFIALLFRELDRNRRSWVPVWLGLFGAFCFFWHQHFPFAVAIAVLAYLAVRGRELEYPRTLVTLAIVAAVSLIPNLPWIYETLRYHEGYAENATQNLVDANMLWRELLGKLGDNARGSKVYPLLLLGALIACVRPGDARRRGLWTAFLASAVALELLAYLGSAVPLIGKIQPNRFAPAGYLLLCIPAACGLDALFRAIVDRVSRARLAAGALGVLVLGAAAVLAWEVRSEVTTGPHARYGATPPQVRPLGEDSAWVLQWLERKTTADQRVLFENSLGRVHDGAHMAGYYAYRSQREFIGGPYPFMNFAAAWDDVAFGKRLADIPIARMREYFSLYNIGAIIAHSPGAKAYFDRMPGVRLDATHGALHVYTVEGESSYFLAGSGRVVERGHNRLTLSDLVGPEVVLKYHYVPGMASDPPVRIDGVRMLDDPNPFVRIKEPPPRLRLYMP